MRPKVAGEPNRPMGVQFHSKDPNPGIENAVKGLLFFSSGNCQNPAVKSKLLKTVDCARPISSMQSWTSLWEYLSMKDLSLIARKSRTGLRVPSFLGTQKIGELKWLRDGETTPNLIQFCKCVIRTDLWLSGMRNCLVKTGYGSLMRMECSMTSVRPRSYLL